MFKYRHHKYTWARRGDWIVHRWELVGPHGAMHFSAQVHDATNPTSERYETSCGLETHYAKAPDYMRDQAPSQVDCPLTGGWCWHDGTSLYASETLWPEFSQYLQSGNHDAIFRTLEYEATRRFADAWDTAEHSPTPAGSEEDGARK